MYIAQHLVCAIACTLLYTIYLANNINCFTPSVLPQLYIRTNYQRISKKCDGSKRREHFQTFRTLQPPHEEISRAVTAASATRNAAALLREAAVEKYVETHGGSKPIRKILVANNGMAAVKCILSIRQWAFNTFGDDKAIQFVAMASPEDLKANAEFVRLANKIVEVPGGINRNNYANTDLICNIAKQEKVDAVWPGWGHASENPKLPEKLSELNIEFIGPTAPVMSALGDKIAANILAQTAGVPSIPWSGGGLKSELDTNGKIDEKVFQKATVKNVEDCVRVANEIGYPIMIKASEGGGGKGIRLVHEEKDLKSAFEQVVNEVKGSPVFMMQLCKNARHIEVQIVGDAHGSAVALSGRDCTTQRRFQKIFEEGPPTSIVPPDTFKEMEKAAQRLTASIGYRSAGTVEFLYNPKDNKYFFLELNPRLQVEHPVTEGITNINLPAAQLQVAMGIPLHRIPDIRQFWGKEAEGTTEIDFNKEEHIPIQKHVIAARITAENPDEGFKPTSGSIDRIEYQSSPNVWGYFSVGADGGIHEYADSQFGHLFAEGSNREEARKSLMLALKRVDVRGEIRTAVEYLSQLLEAKGFVDNTIDTSWLDGLIKEKSVDIPIHKDGVVVAAALFNSLQTMKKREKDILYGMQRGQLFNPAIQHLNIIKSELIYDDVKYVYEVERTGREMYTFRMNGQTIEIRIREQADGSIIAEYGGRTHKFNGRDEPLGLRMSLDGATVFIPHTYDASELRSDVNGKLVRYLVAEGEEVECGQPYAEVEAMKMIMTMKSAESGVLSHTKSPGSIITAGELLANLKLKSENIRKKIELYNGKLNVLDNPSTDSLSIDPVSRLEYIMQGFKHPIDETVQTILAGSMAEDPDVMTALINRLLQQFLDVETLFDDNNRDSVIGELLKANKENLSKVLDVELAHLQLSRRLKLVSVLLRALEKFPFRYRGWTMPQYMESTLLALSNSKGKEYGEVSLEADRILRTIRVPPFEERCEDLKLKLSKCTTSEAAQKLGEETFLAAGEDLLIHLMMTDTSVADRTKEVYVRRVYRGHRIEWMPPDVDGEERGALWRFQWRELPSTAVPWRMGGLFIPKGVEEMKQNIGGYIQRVGANGNTNNCEANVLYLGLPAAMELPAGSEKEMRFVNEIEVLLKQHEKELFDAKIHSVNLFIPNSPMNPRYFSFYASRGFSESKLYRDTRPSFPSLMELDRLSENYDLQRLNAVGSNTRIYLGKQKQHLHTSQTPQTVFIRSLSYDSEILDRSKARQLLIHLMDELERSLLDPRVALASGRIYLHIIPTVYTSVRDVVEQSGKILMDLKTSFSERLLRLRLDQIELKVHVDPRNGDKKVIRLAATSEGGMWLHSEVFEEMSDGVTGEPVGYKRIRDGASLGSIQPYPSFDKVELRRTAARRAGSTYVYDFLGLTEIALVKKWRQFIEEGGRNQSTLIPSDLLKVQEFRYDKQSSKLTLESSWKVGRNEVGMVGWLLEIKTPEYPLGRPLVVLANDITHQSGSFGVEEDEYYAQVSSYARQHGIPRIYISCNSGARIGLADELKDKISIEWENPSSPGMGFKYMYLTEDKFNEVENDSICTEEVMVNGEKRYILKAIIGKEDKAIGVENLRGSGKIAGETSRSYDETFTLSYVTGRSVGIGAYIVRLGQRVIQLHNSPIILTGYQALNKLLSKEVYASQSQLGGPQIMHSNGVSHIVVENDLEGMEEVLQWLSYIPKTKSMKILKSTSTDDVDRKIGYNPQRCTPSDVRHLFTGRETSSGEWESGFFDKSSFKEYLAGWGKGVVVGRARLGGIPVGVIGVDTRSVSSRIPADPADAESHERLLPQAGQVWFPDSAYKTAQAIEDFNRGENLPLFIFANWRGFSGGTRDMFDQVLKFGAMIVDALRKYKHPVFVYIPVNGELRGGAWVVVDPSINTRKMEMYADVESRGGILEAAGICEIKFRVEDQLKLMHKSDVELINLDKQLENFQDGDGLSLELKQDIKKRETALLPIYLQIAHAFADLHDKSERMKAKGVIRDSINWPNARSYFYWRLRRRLAEDNVKDTLLAINSELSDESMKEMILMLIPSNINYEDDKAMLQFFESDEGSNTINDMVEQYKHKVVLDTIRNLLNDLPNEKRNELIKKFSVGEREIEEIIK